MKTILAAAMMASTFIGCDHIQKNMMVPEPPPIRCEIQGNTITVINGESEPNAVVRGININGNLRGCEITIPDEED